MYNNNPVPGAGGLPSLSGLNNRMNPMAQELQDQGRGEDTMLVHMTPDEVNSLQGLAMAHGGSLTINPETGLPEAGFLKKLLPTLLGAALTATGIGAPLAAGLVAAGSVAKTGSLKKGLMAGLQAYGGAGMAGAAGLGGKISSNAFGALSSKPGIFGANMGLGAAAAPGMASGVTGTAPTLGTVAPSAATTGGVQTVTGAVVDPTLSINALGPINPGAATALQGGGAQFTGGLGSRFAQATRAGLPGGTPGIISKAAPRLAAMGLAQGVSGALTPSGGGTVSPDGRVDNSFQGPYYAQDRQRILDPEGPLSSKQRRHFAVDMPEIYNTMGQVVQPGSHTARGTQIMQPVLNPSAKKSKNDKGKPMYSFMPVTYMGGVDPEEEEGMGYSKGGELQIADGGFIVDARSVAEGGRGYTKAGFDEFKKLGGIPIEGPGNGVSDSIPARIGGTQPARVAAGEVYMPPEAVRRIGKGNPKHGADRLYAMMNEAHKATKRGQERNILRGLA
jgi:hypothetical protein